MRRRHRRRYGHYPLAGSTSRLESLKPSIALVILAIALLLFGYWIVQRFASNGNIYRLATLLTLEERGTVNVALEGGKWHRAEQDIKLYPGDRVSTGANSHASLQFLDGTQVRMQENTVVTIMENAFHGKEHAQQEFTLESGLVWFHIPERRSFTGSVTSTVTTDAYNAQIPSGTEALFGDRTITLFTSDGLGAEVAVEGLEEMVVVGEGQSLALPNTIVSGMDLYAYRTPLDPRAMASPFLQESRDRIGITASAPEPPTPDTTEPVITADILSISTPADEEIVTAGTVTVSGSTGESVTSVRVNGYGTEPQGAAKQFSLELALPDEEQVSITIEAIADDGSVVDQAIRTIYRHRDPPDSPHFLEPISDGGVYKTAQGKLTIVGTAPQNAVGIIVNDFRLQKFTPGTTSWSYIANEAFDNFQRGENIFTAKAVGKNGLESEPVTITVILGDEEGVVTPGGSVDAAENPGSDLKPADLDPGSLPDNAPTAPGTLKVTGPTPGTTHTATGSELLIEGLAPEGAETIWVNDYRLRLFDPSKGLWNYIASAELGTMRRGINAYTVTARNAEGFIVDQVVYTIEFNPRGQ